MVPTTIALQLADRSIKHPVGVLEDVPVKVGRFYIPADFVVLDMPEDNHTPILLGRPFMATGGVVIDVQKGILKFNVGEEEVNFHLPDAIKAPMVEDSLLVEVKDNLEKAMTIFDKENGVRIEDYVLEEVNIVSKVEGASLVKVKSNGHDKTRARKKEAKARSMRKSKRLSEAVKRVLDPKEYEAKLR